MKRAMLFQARETTRLLRPSSLLPALANVLPAQDNYGPKQACISFMAVRKARAAARKLRPTLRFVGHRRRRAELRRAQVQRGVAGQQPRQKRALSHRIVDLLADDFPRVRGVFGAASARDLREQRAAAGRHNRSYRKRRHPQVTEAYISPRVIAAFSQEQRYQYPCLIAS